MRRIQSDKDPMLQVTIVGKELQPARRSNQRVGRPRKIWTEEAMDEAWKQLGGQDDYVKLAEQNSGIVSAALVYECPFATKRRNTSCIEHVAFSTQLVYNTPQPEERRTLYLATRI